MYVPDKAKKNVMFSDKFVNCFLSRQGTFYLVAKAVWDYAKTKMEAVPFNTGDIMHDEYFRSYFKTMCSNRSFDVNVKVQNMGEAWIDKTDPAAVLQQL